MYNALSGIGGSGQVDSTVAANGNVALLSCTAATALFLAGPLFSLVGPRITFLLGGWTYALYSGSLLNYNHTMNGAFVIGAAAILGIGASFLWVVQGAIMTTYVPESQKGRVCSLLMRRTCRVLQIANLSSLGYSCILDNIQSRRRDWKFGFVRH